MLNFSRWISLPELEESLSGSSRDLAGSFLLAEAFSCCNCVRFANLGFLEGPRFVLS